MPERLTPVDILNLRFRRSPVGYAIAEVDDFVRRVAADMEAVLAEVAQQREKIAGQERELAQYRTLEVTLRDALVLAQKTADETRAAARQQAAAEVQEAQTRAREIEAQSHARLAEVNSQVERLRQEHRRLVRDLRAQLTAQLAWLSEELEASASETQEEPIPHNGRNLTAPAEAVTHLSDTVPQGDTSDKGTS